MEDIKLTKAEFLNILNRARIKVTNIELRQRRATAYNLTIDVVNRTILAVRDEVIPD